jgi:hypothetical protein
MESFTGSEREFVEGLYLREFRRFYGLIDSRCSRLAWGGGKSQSSEGKRDLDAVVFDPFRRCGIIPFSDTHLSLNERLNDER